MLTYQDVRRNEDINTYIKMADRSLGALGFTEHSFAHVAKVSATAKYIMEIKLKEAANILRTSDTSIAEIAYSLGFSSQSHFSKCFADKYQKTPLQYRKGYKE